MSPEDREQTITEMIAARQERLEHSHLFTRAAALSSSTVASPTLTGQELQDRLVEIRALLDSAPPDPLGDWMRSKGFPPEDYNLILPEEMREKVGPFPPRYVVFTELVVVPHFAMNFARMLRHGPTWPVDARKL